MSEIQDAIQKYGLDAVLSRELIELVRLARNAAVDECVLVANEYAMEFPRFSPQREAAIACGIRIGWLKDGSIVPVKGAPDHG
jgi:hypothetical protein